MIASKAGFTEVDQQLDDAIDFLNRHEKALQQLAAYSGVEDAVLDFGIEDRDVGAQADYFRPELLLAMGRLKIGLVVSRYPCSKVKGVE